MLVCPLEYSTQVDRRVSLSLFWATYYTLRRPAHGKLLHLDRNTRYRRQTPSVRTSVAGDVDRG